MRTDHWRPYIPRYNGGRLLLFTSRAELAAYFQNRFGGWPPFKMIRRLTIEIAATTCKKILDGGLLPLRLTNRGTMALMTCDSHCGVIREIISEPDAQGLVRVKTDLYGPAFN